MVWRSWPHDYQPDGTTRQETYEDDFRFSLSAATQDGIDRIFGTGLVASVSGNDIVVGTGRGVVDGYGFAADAPEPVTIPTNSSALPRIYRVVARLDVAAHQVTVYVLEGTASSSPQPPVLTRSENVYDLPLWRLRRDGGGGTITDLTDERVYLNPSGPVACTSSTRPPSPLPGTQVYETDTGRLVYWHDGQWVTAADGTYPTSWQPILLYSGHRHPGHGFAPEWRWDSPGVVRLRGRIGRSDEAVLENGSVIARVPSAARAAETQAWAVASTSRRGSTVEDRGNTSRLEMRSANSSGDDGQLIIYTEYNPLWIGLDGVTYVV